jgi:hypothetical protein
VSEPKIDATGLLNSLDLPAMRARLAELDSEREDLMILIQAAVRRQNKSVAQQQARPYAPNFVDTVDTTPHDLPLELPPEPELPPGSPEIDPEVLEARGGNKAEPPDHADGGPDDMPLSAVIASRGQEDE